MHAQDGITSYYNWSVYINHIIATIITTVFAKTTKQVGDKKTAPFYRHYAYAPDLFDLINHCKTLSTHVKQVGLQEQLDKTIKQENMIRWNSLLKCLSNIAYAYEQLVVMLTVKKSAKIAKIDKELMMELITFFQPFQEATLAMEIIRHLIKEEFIIQQIHVIVSLLDPRIRRRLVKYGLSEEQIGKAKENLESLMKEHIPKQDQDDNERGLVKKPKINHVRGRRQLTEYNEKDDLNHSEGATVKRINSLDQTVIKAHTVNIELA
ncbi:hypothetical protein AXG93_773s1040 [Marchantia polymorpha subsp. ruderalis]|uniref:Uncharacterized protein n=1 Tax=Marchantia polymorpha subsp. ruderalis TaxID=1480154 RepID=A0A176WCM1_MARPO|nr:hypothetical protein AXG93_773s1040 [Marchantia polymorpha subsp. ruderalis]